MAEANTSASMQSGLSSFWSTQYRLVLVSGFGTYLGRWIESIVGTWLILEMTDSPFLVGLLGVCRFLGMLLGPFCGMVCDRYDRRRILIAVQVAYGSTSLIVMGLFLTGWLVPWHLFVYTIIAGVSYTFDFSTRYVVVADIVEARHLVPAISIVFVLQSSTAVLGPLLGGSLLDVIGPGGCFALVTASFVLSLAALLRLKATKRLAPRIGESMWRNLADGFSYVRKDRSLLAMMLFAAVANFFLFTYYYTLTPIFARDILHTDASGFGQLMAAVGFGSTIGSVITAWRSREGASGKLIVIAMLAWPVMLIGFAVSRVFGLSLLLLAIVGFGQGMSMALIQSLMLVWSSEEMRGRVSGIRALAIGFLPLGNFLTGAWAGLWGATLTLIVNAVAGMLSIALITAWAREILRRK